MKKTFFMCLALMIAALTQAAVQQTTVFAMVGNENKTVTSTGVTNGTPAVTFKSQHTTFAGAAASDPSFNTTDYVKVGNAYSTTESTQGINQMSANIDGYAAPFALKLKECAADSIVWTFNMRYNYDYTDGFGAGKRGVATVLAMDNADLQLGNGYAVVNMKTKEYSLVKIKDGLNATDNVTKLLTVATSGNKKYMAFRVVYVPQTDVWRFYACENAASNYDDPLTCAYTKVGEVADATYTNTAMTNFGFLNSYSGKSNYQTLLVRNYMVRAYKTIADAIDVYSNSFCTTASTALNNVASGTPAVTFTNNQSISAGDAPAVPATNLYYLQVQNKKASGANGKNILTAPIANFNAPFKAKLSEIEADSVVWTFNFRNNNSNASKGFYDAQFGFANVLVADNSNLLQGNGYAVIMGKTNGGNGDKHIYLARYTNGLSANDNITTILNTPECTLKKYWTIRVVYIPATNTWKLGWCEGQDAFVAPMAANWTDCGSVVDATYTSNTMTTFGFLVNYSGNNDGIMYVRDYAVHAYPHVEPVKESTLVKMYANSFTAQDLTPMDGKLSGTPKVLFTNTKYNYGTAEDAPVPTIQGELLVAGKKAADSKGRNILTAPMSGFAAPFNSKLDQIAADSLVWMFNMRYNYDYTSSFANGNRAIATVLAMDNSDLLEGNGYAVVNNETKYYKLVRVTGGLDDNANLETLVSTPKLGSNKSYMTFKVVYVPATHLWKMYYVVASAYIKPENADFIYLGSQTDATYTNTDMTTFGFMTNYQQSNSFDVAMSVKNFTFGAYTSSVVIDEHKNNDAYLAAFDGQTIDVNLVRTLKGGMWNTLCVPFDMSAEQITAAFGDNCQLAQLSNAEMDGETTLNLDFDDAITTIEAGVPYLIKPNQDVTTASLISDVMLDKQPQTIDKTLAKMVGEFSPTKLEASINTLYLGTNNTLYYVAEDSELAGMRAYFILSDEASKASVRRVNIGRQVVTELAAPASADQGVCKIMKDGQLIIIREGVQYNAQGARL